MDRKTGRRIQGKERFKGKAEKNVERERREGRGGEEK